MLGTLLRPAQQRAWPGSSPAPHTARTRAAVHGPGLWLPPGSLRIEVLTSAHTGSRGETETLSPRVIPSSWQPVLVPLPSSITVLALEGFGGQDMNGPRPQQCCGDLWGAQPPRAAVRKPQAAHPQAHLLSPDTPDKLTSVLKSYHLCNSSVISGVSFARVRGRENHLINHFPISKRQGVVLPISLQRLSSHPLKFAPL